MTIVKWINHEGEPRSHSLMPCSLSYARDWWRQNIYETQGIMSIDARRNSKLRFVEVLNYTE